jgi:hypothetical protein
MTTPVTPVAGPNTFITTGGVSVIAIFPAPNGGYITNPLNAADQGIGTAEPLYVDPVGSCSVLQANTTTFALPPGETWNVIPGQTTPTFVNAATNGHKFTAVSF